MTLYFETIKEDCSEFDELFIELKFSFKRFIEPIYGNQEKFLEKIRKGRDRKCKLLMNNGSVEGVLVYKIKNSSEFQRFGAHNALEIKTLMLIHNNRKLSGLMVTALYREAAIAAIEKKSSCIIATVSSGLRRAYNIAKKLGFQEINRIENKNITSSEELIICHSDPFLLFRVTNEFKMRYENQKKSGEGKIPGAV